MPHTSNLSSIIDSTDTEVVLEASELVKVFHVGSQMRPQNVAAVSGISLQLHKGEVIGIVGESGCGKSTLARMLVGLDKPSGGTLRYRGTDVTRGRMSDRKLLRSGVQMIFQDPYTSLDPRMTVYDIIAEPLTSTRKLTAAGRRERVAELLGLVGLSPSMMSRFPHQFSGGQRQRIGIARALALDPDVLVCDEPVSALDVSVQAQVVNLLRDIQKRLGVSIIFIAHDLSVVRHIADRVAVMYLGEVIEVGDTDSIFDAPSHPYTQSLMSASPSIDRADRGRLSRRRVLEGEPPSPLNPPSGCHFNPRCWMATDACQTNKPRLRTIDLLPRQVSCHHAEEAVSSAAVAASTGTTGISNGAVVEL